MAQYTLGVTSQSEWDALRASRSSFGAPWAELIVPGRVAILFPSDYLNASANIAESLTVFKGGVENIQWLGGFSRIVPIQRINIDADAGEGIDAYAGYPITMRWSWKDEWTESKAKFCSGNRDWIWWHEMGHNFQVYVWLLIH